MGQQSIGVLAQLAMMFAMVVGPVLVLIAWLVGVFWVIYRMHQPKKPKPKIYGEPYNGPKVTECYRDECDDCPDYKTNRCPF